MGDMHNLQIVVSLAPRKAKIVDGLINGATNGAQIINVVSQEARDKERSQVKETAKANTMEAAKREDEKSKKEDEKSKKEDEKSKKEDEKSKKEDGQKKEDEMNKGSKKGRIIDLYR